MIARWQHTAAEQLRGLGRYALFLYQSFRSITDIGMYRKNLIPQMVRVGIDSLPVVMLATAFIALVTTVQTAYMLTTTILTEDAIGAIVVPSLMLELGALTVGLVMASRIGASIAAEMGTMRVTEQIDALEAMGLNAVAYLVIPRVVAGVVMFPVLYVAGCLAGVVISGLAGEWLGYLTFERFIVGARDFFLPFDPAFGAGKTAVFGFLITSIACAKGYFTEGGAEGVGRSATEAVVTSCVMILLADYVMAELLL